MELEMLVLDRTKLTRSAVKRSAFDDDTAPIAVQSATDESPVSVKTTRDDADRKELNEQPDLISVPLMGIKLIEPLAPSDAAGGKAPAASWGLEAIRAPAAMNAGRGVTVAVLDTGIAEHPAFKGVHLVPRNFTKDPDDSDTNGHGTHCAGTIFGRDVDGCRIGIARGVDRALIGKVIGSGGGSTADILKAIYWALGEGAHVISMSLGIDFVGFQERLAGKVPPQKAAAIALAGYRDTIRLFDDVSNAIAGINVQTASAVVVAATGNESDRPNYAITTAPPAAARHFVAAGAVAPKDKNGGYPIATFSNEGAKFVGPGVDIWSAKPGGGLVAMSGTSMATPHVAGVAALYAAETLPNFTASAVIDRMRATALKWPGLAATDVTDGMVQYEKAP